VFDGETRRFGEKAQLNWGVESYLSTLKRGSAPDMGMRALDSWRRIGLFACAAIFVISFAPGLFAQAAKKNSSPAKTATVAAQGTGGAAATVDPRELVRHAADLEMANQKIANSYTYVQRSETKKIDGDGKVTSTESETAEVMVLYGEHVERLIAKNDQPLSAKDAAKAEDKINKFMDERKNETDEQRRKRLADKQKDEEQAKAYVAEIADAYNFTLDGIEKINGRDAYKISGEPRPGYEPKSRFAKFLPKFHFKVWIDTQDRQWVKLDAEALADASYGLFLVRIHKNSRFSLEQTRVNDEVWLPLHIHGRIDARILIFKSLNEELDFTYRDYKKYRAEIKLGGTAPMVSP
jgi:hypothetical protein